MHILAISDLHGWLPPALPACDLLLIAGDICPDTEASGPYAWRPISAPLQAQWLGSRFAPWLEAQAASTIVMCWGNHDYVGELPDLVPPLPAIVLTDETREIEGRRIYATPWTHFSPAMWAFDVPLATLARTVQRIPADTDILSTHGPAFGICDRTVTGESAGSRALADVLTRIHGLRLHVFGHIHEARGRVGRHYNVSLLDADYRPYRMPVTEIEI